MSLHSNEQLLHDRVNLTRLVRRLDKAIAVPGWEKDDVLDSQIKTQGMLQVYGHWMRCASSGLTALTEGQVRA